jgi:hypothetical protein
MSLDAGAMKRSLWWFLPLVVGSIALCVWGFAIDVPRMYVELQQQAPSLRIRIGSLLMPFGAFMFCAILLLMPLRIFRIEKYAVWVEKYLLLGSLIALFIAAPTVLIGGHILQQAYLPDRGYTECNKLSGAPSAYFTDWVKNPAWCVYKKDHGWVREQAAKAEAVRPQTEIETPSRAQ